MLGQVRTAEQDVDQAMDVLFNHPNVGPFVSRQLIQQLVTSTPSPAYVAAITAVFDNPAARGDRQIRARARAAWRPEGYRQQARRDKTGRRVRRSPDPRTGYNS